MSGLLDILLGQRRGLLDNPDPVDALRESLPAGPRRDEVRMPSPGFRELDTRDPTARMALRAGVGQTVDDTARMYRQATDAAGWGGTMAGIRGFHGSPHLFSAERLVRLPDGRTEYLVGRPDVLPDVPQGATVLRDFPLGRFRMDKIGTGEGNQAFGHGPYIAEAEPVALRYRDQLSRPYYATRDGQDIGQKYGSDVLDAFEGAAGDPALIGETVARLRRNVQRNLSDFGVQDVSQLRPQYDGDLASQTISSARRADNLEALMRSGDVRMLGEGRMYEVELRTSPDRLLDWDAPLSAQPEAVRRLYERGNLSDTLRLARVGRGPEEITGQELYNLTGTTAAIRQGWDGGSSSVPSAEAARLLRAAGIDGIRYLDGGSRGAGEGTRNYVMFDDRLIDILRRYAIPGFLGGGAAATNAEGLLQ